MTMTNNELISLGEREAQRLDDENDHGAAIIMREMCDRLRSRPDGGMTYAPNIDARGADAEAVARLAAAMAEDRKKFDTFFLRLGGQAGLLRIPGVFA